MWAGAWRLVAWGSISAVALASCRENVYLGDPTYVADRVTPDAQSSEVDASPRPDVTVPDARPLAWYLHAVGSKIYDSADAPVHLKGINWSGMQAPPRVPDGLHALSVDAML